MNLFTIYFMITVPLTGILFWICWPQKSENDTNPYS
jgi:hypothetical protein